MIRKAIREQVPGYDGGAYYIVECPAPGDAGSQSPGAAPTRGDRRVSERSRRQRLGEWRQAARQHRRAIRARSRGPQIPGGEAAAEAAVRALHAALVARAERAEADFRGQAREWLWDQRLPAGYEFVPFLTAAFSGAACACCPLQEACRRWYRAQHELRKMGALMHAAAGGSWADALAKARRLHEWFLGADAAWLVLRRLHREAARPGGRVGPEAPVDWLTAWAADRIGEAHLRPRMERADPGAGGGSLSAALLDEIWGTVLTLWPGSLPVLDFCGLPGKTAAGVRALYTNPADEVNRLTAGTRERLEDLHRPGPCPEAAVLERAALIEGLMSGLPKQERRAIELRAAGLSRKGIAAAMGVGEETVKEDLSRARKRLRSELGAGDRDR